MSNGEYDPLAFNNAMGIFKERLRERSPEALQILESPTVGQIYLPEGFVYHFFDQDRDSFERLSKPPLVDRLAEAVEAIEFDVKLKFKDLGTSLEQQILLQHAPAGIRIVRKIRDGSGNEQDVDRN